MYATLDSDGGHVYAGSTVYRVEAGRMTRLVIDRLAGSPYTGDEDEPEPTMFVSKDGCVYSLAGHYASAAGAINAAMLAQVDRVKAARSRLADEARLLRTIAECLEKGDGTEDYAVPP